MSAQEKSDRQHWGWERRYSRERLRSLERQHSLEQPLLIREYSRERLAYEAPNGTLFNAVEMRTLALGLKLRNHDKVYFLPCFIEDPWKGLKPTPSIRPPNLMDWF